MKLRWSSSRFVSDLDTFLYTTVPQSEEFEMEKTGIGNRFADVTVEASPDITIDGDDKDAMRQMGKKQQLLRRFKFVPILALSITLLSSWEAMGSTMGLGLSAGGAGSSCLRLSALWQRHIGTRC